MTDESEKTPPPSGEATPPPEPAPPPPAPPPSRRGGLLEWFWRGEALATATAKAKASPAVTERRRIARLALEIAERTREPVEPFRVDGHREQAIELYRRAMSWGLAAHLPDGADVPDLGALFEGQPGLLAEVCAAASIDVASVRAMLVDGDARRDLASPVDADVLARTARAVRGVVERATAEERAVEELVFARFARTILLLVVVSGITLGVTLGVLALTKRNDLGKGRPWRASSTWAVCDVPKRTCGAVTDTNIFFHTNEDASPWFELDLGPGKRYSGMTIKNRSDYGPDRAIPLVVEVSDDQVSWKEIARRNETFSVWKPVFASQTARWVRVRVLKKSWLHLEQVAVHP